MLYCLQWQEARETTPTDHSSQSTISDPFIDVMDLPQTKSSNRHVLAIQGFLTKCLWVFPTPDQKTSRIVEILVQEISPVCGVPECLLSDWGTNWLSYMYLMKDVWALLRIEKLNTTVYHPQCDRLTEWFNRMLSKQADLYGKQWDQYLHRVLWAYRNTLHEATIKKFSFLLYGRDCRYPLEAAFLPADEIKTAELTDYRNELTMTLSEAHDLAAQSIQAAQKKYKHQYDWIPRCLPVSRRLGTGYSYTFPQEESGSTSKLSCPWHGPYTVVAQRV